MSKNTAQVTIIGAGIAGIMAARVLEAQGIDVMVFDKGRSVGGRLATRRVGPGLADHGAQFFTVRSDAFQEWVDEWMHEGLVYEWSTGFSDGSLITEHRDGHPRYAANGGLNALPKYLAKGLNNVRVGMRVVTATCDENGWILQDEEGDLYLSKALIMTPPVPQALQILDEGATLLSREDQATLNSIEYAPCLAGMFWVEGRFTLPPPGAIQRRSGNITWVADNRQKGISPEATIVTVHASETYSTQMWNAPDERIIKALRTDIQLFMDPKAQIKDAQLKRWRYSRPLSTYEGRCLVADNSPPLIFAGDAFGGPRVEGAVLSGLAAGHTMLERIPE